MLQLELLAADASRLSLRVCKKWVCNSEISSFASLPPILGFPSKGGSRLCTLKTDGGASTGENGAGSSLVAQLFSKGRHL